MTTQSTLTEITDFFTARLPTEWRDGPLDVTADDDEILVVVPIAAGGEEPQARIAAFREETRAQRMSIASDAESTFRRKVSWGARCAAAGATFTALGVPVMTRLRINERALLDTLVEGGVARSRSEALAWCVRLVGQHQADWLADLREALVGVRRARADGPTLV
jgi:hypothetical protein